MLCDTACSTEIWYIIFCRFEAKHQYFKKLSQKIGNYINVSKTLAKQHQLLMALHGMEPVKDIELGKGMLLCVFLSVNGHFKIDTNNKYPQQCSLVPTLPPPSGLFLCFHHDLVSNHADRLI